MRDDFDGADLDRSVWLPHYLPAWSSRGATAASYRVADSCLVLDVPVEHPVWLAGDHEPPLRVSAVQSGSWSGPVGSTRGQQRFREGQVVRTAEPRFEGWLPSSGHVEVRCRMTLSPRSMGALWLSGTGFYLLFKSFGRADFRWLRRRRKPAAVPGAA